ncbi:protein-disulfide isomerase [Humitalea rosea]|uniref:Protein-disulfide isomerase n=1 Tax=Humitalea rosea TaxID=990373 RepID=A0A2W7IN36_9PROT|nr:DsbA family protein [Humitalea rosea]PZW48373.1 protein-disulfide isomerase [Humitalea rosea]
MTTTSRRRLILGLALALPGLPALAQALTEAQRAEVVEVLRRALREDPSILREAMIALQQSEATAAADRQRAVILAHADALFRDAADPVLGNTSGDVTIVEFFDARCGYCKQMHPAITALLAKDRGVRLVLKDLPILGPSSVVASRALLAAQRQGRYAALHDALMRLNGEPSEAVLRVQAEHAGADWARLRRDMDDPSIQRRIAANVALAQTLGIEGTPALVISGTHALVPGAVDLAALERLVAESRAAS